MFFAHPFPDAGETVLDYGTPSAQERDSSIMEHGTARVDRTHGDCGRR
jgi:hypothetical protein